MRHIALSGISDKVLGDLEREKVKTVEIRSPHNFLSALQTNVGDMIFLTATSQDDLRPGTTGLIVRVLEKQVLMHRIIQKTTEFYEESEFQLARLQLEMRGRGRVRRAECCKTGEATVVDADEVLFFEGR